MALKIIVVGDSTSHGGHVISGSPTHNILDKPIARLGDLVECPLVYPGGKPHGVNKIIEGHSTFILDGIPVALEGHKTECGCTLIGSIGATVG
ncbi:MAG: repeat containing protein [Collimonas fungivorans]|uniref:PAAR domain-containing protein n=1 Tax=Collimonas fungivorans TaxID=158899 RepID=UPI000E7527D0|nr:PAAR domain-containing protein [Collimonas fungivorans]MDB5768238.1 repeat containing protein [Collimonas fungivorans]